MSGLDKVEVEIAVALGHCDMRLGAFLRFGRGARFRLTTAGQGVVEVLAGSRPFSTGRLIRGRNDRIAVEIGAAARSA